MTNSFAQRDLQSQLLVPVVQQAAPAIRALYPSCVIGICAVRKYYRDGVFYNGVQGMLSRYKRRI